MIVTATNFTQTRFDQLKAMLSSLSVNSSEDSIRVHLVDFPFKPELERINPLCEVFMEKENLDKKKSIAGFMVCYRSVVLLHALTECRESVAWFDTDVLVRRSLDSFWEGVNGCVLQIMSRENQPHKTRFQAGIFAVGNNPKTIQMITEFNDKLQKQTKWYEDQKILFEIYEKNKREVRHLQLDSEFNDWHFDEKSTIWHSKSSHFSERRFQNEFQFYLKKAESKL